MAVEQLKIPEPALRRLPWYLSYAKLVQRQGGEYVSSTQIALNIDIDASIVAKDLSYVNVAGRTRVGYCIADLISTLEGFLGFKSSHRAFLFGVGSLGGALLQDRGLEQFGLDIVAGFDAKYELAGTSINRVPIHHVDRFRELQEKIHVEIGVLAVPADRAQEVSDVLVEGGIKAIWNFTPYRIRVPKHIVVQNTSIYAHLALMFRRLKELE